MVYPSDTREIAWRDTLSQAELEVANRVAGMDGSMAISWVAVELHRLGGKVDTITTATTAAALASPSGGKVSSMLVNVFGAGLGGGLLVGVYIAGRLMGFIH